MVIEQRGDEIERTGIVAILFPHHKPGALRPATQGVLF
jgi:hypothetical protein